MKMNTGREGSFAVFLEDAVGGAGHAHGVEHLVVFLVGDLLVADLVAGALVAVRDELGNGHQLRPVDVQGGVVVLGAPVQGVSHSLGAVLAGDVGHLAVALVVLQHAVQLHIGEVVGDHGLGVLGVPQEESHQAARDRGVVQKSRLSYRTKPVLCRFVSALGQRTGALYRAIDNGLDQKSEPLKRGTVVISIDLFWVISNIIRNTLEDFMWKCRWNIRWRKM